MKKEKGLFIGFKSFNHCLFFGRSVMNDNIDVYKKVYNVNICNVRKY